MCDKHQIEDYSKLYKTERMSQIGEKLFAIHWKQNICLLFWTKIYVSIFLFFNKILQVNTTQVDKVPLVYLFLNFYFNHLIVFRNQKKINLFFFFLRLIFLGRITESTECTTPFVAAWSHLEKLFYYRIICGYLINLLQNCRLIGKDMTTIRSVE